MLEDERLRLKKTMERLCSAMWKEESDAQRHGMKLIYIDLMAQYEKINEIINYNKRKGTTCETQQQ